MSTNAHVWGLDLSGSLQGAGGTGGLPAASGLSSNLVLYAYDADGNVAHVVGAHNGSLAATYGPDPYGNLLEARGNAAKSNSSRFSTKQRSGFTSKKFKI